MIISTVRSLKQRNAIVVTLGSLFFPFLPAHHHHLLQMLNVTTEAEVAKVMTFIRSQFAFRAELNSFLRRCREGDYTGNTIRNCIYQQESLSKQGNSIGIQPEVFALLRLAPILNNIT